MKNNAAATKVLLALTSHAQLGNTGKSTGYYLSELSHPYTIFEQAGLKMDLVSPQRGKAPLDENSRDLTDPINREFLDRKNILQQLDNTAIPQQVNAKDYHGILFVGGHGAMWDFPNHAELQHIAATIYENGGIVAAVCHGPASLVNLKLSDGSYLINGKKLTGFSHAEEEAVGLSQIVPFPLESTLVDRGAFYTKAPLWQKHVVMDGRLLTGQNPASATALGEAIVHVLRGD